MAVIESLGLAVSVVINGTPVAEYDDPDPDPDVEREFPGAKVISKYIESTDDTEYAIRCDALPTHRWVPSGPDNVLTCNVDIDGNYQTGICLRAARWDRGVSKTVEGVVRAVTGSRGALNKFNFSAVDSLDDANARRVKEDLKRAKHLGLIRVKMYRTVKPPTTAARYRDADEAKEKHDLSIAEKALKGRAVSHGTTFSPATETKAPRSVTLQWIDNKPWAVFDFKYRSKDALRSEMILPRTPSPSPVPSLSGLEDIENLSQEDIQRLARERLAEIKNERVAKREAPGVKREFGEAFDRPADRNRNVRSRREQLDVKREGNRDVKPVIIDLSDD